MKPFDLLQTLLYVLAIFFRLLDLYMEIACLILRISYLKIKRGVTILILFGLHCLSARLTKQEHKPVSRGAVRR